MKRLMLSNLRRALPMVAALLVLVSLGLRAPRSAAVTLDPYLVFAPGGPLTNANLGVDVADAGDVDNDGVPDFMAGMITADSAVSSNTHAARVYSGKTGALLWDFARPEPSEQSLNSVAGVGDVNGDKYGDVAVGTPGMKKGGIVRVFSGKTGALLGQRNGDATGDLFGGAVASVQDVDGDKIGELLVGAQGRDAGGFNAGAAYLLSGATLSPICVLNGTQPEEQFGMSVAGVGDVNGDGRGDFAVGAPAVAREQPGKGRVYLFAGGLRQCPSLHVWEGKEPGDTFGFAVAGAGDVTGDKIPDVVVGSPRLARAKAKLPAAPGRADVFSGASADGYALVHTFDGTQPNDLFGHSVDGDGACDADDAPDIIVGAPQTKITAAFDGKAYIFSGKTGSEIISFDASDVNDLFGTNVAWVGQLVGKQPPDELVVGAPGRDANGYPASGAAQVLSCEKIPRPEIEVTPATINMGDVAPGSSTSGIATIRNVGDADLHVSLIQLVPASTSPDYSIISGGAPATIAPGGTLEVKVGYAPGALGNDLGVLRIASNDLDEPNSYVSLTGRGAAPDIAVNPTDVDCGEDCTVNAAKSTIVTVKNVGNTSLTITSLSFAGGSSPAFTLLNPPALPRTLGDGDTLNLTVVFTPVDDALATGTLQIGSDDPDEPSVAVTLKGKGKVNLAPVARAKYFPLNSASLPPRTFQFTAKFSTDADGTVDKFFWDFGDGATSTDISPVHTYAADGTYIALLTVFDNKGDSDKTSAAAEASATPVRSRFYGTVSQSDGSGLPEETVITAYVNGAPRATTYSQVKTGASLYAIRVPGSAPDEGVEVVFVVGGCKALETGRWESQSDTELNLTFDAACLAGASTLHLPMVAKP